MKTIERIPAPGFDPSLYPKFRTASGMLTPYSFACGYVECYGVKNGIPRATISREPNDYHVKGFDRDGVHFWESFERVKDARAYARKQAGKQRLANS